MRDDVLAGEVITDADVRRAGEPERESLRHRAAHAGPIDDGTLLYRVTAASYRTAEPLTARSACGCVRPTHQVAR